MNQKQRDVQPKTQHIEESNYIPRDKGIKDEKNFVKFIKWVKRNRRKAERFNNKIKKSQILNEIESNNSEQMKKRMMKQNEQGRQSKVNQLSQANLADKSRKNSFHEGNIKQYESLNDNQMRKESQSNAISPSLAPLQARNSQKKLSKDNIDPENEQQQLLQNTSTIKTQQDQLQKKREQEENEFKLQIRREMMVDDSIGGKLSYKLMLKMEEFFQHYQLKNPKEKEKIINHFIEDKCEDILQKPNVEQEGAFADDKDFIRRDSYWANLFAKDNDVYQIRTPEQFINVNENDLYFPVSSSLIDTNISETIQDKLNKIKVIRFRDRIEVVRKRVKQREELKKQAILENMKQAKEQKEQEQLLLDLKERQRKQREKMQEYDYSIDDQDNVKGVNSNKYSINQGKRNSRLINSMYGTPSTNMLTTTATQEMPTKSLVGQTYSTIIEGQQSSMKKRVHALELDDIEFDQIHTIHELKKKKNAINKLYEKLFPIEQKEEHHERQNKSRFFKLEETPQHPQKESEKYINILTPQNLFKDTRKSINNSQIYKTPSQQLSRQSSISQSQNKLIHQLSTPNQMIHDFNGTPNQSRKSTLQLQKEKQRKQQEQAPAKLQKQYQTYFQLENLPYMSEIGVPHSQQLQQYATILEDYCHNPFEKITQLNEIIEDNAEQLNPEIVRKKIFKEEKPQKPRFEMKKFDEIEFLQKKVNFQYREKDKIDKFNTVDDEQDQILSHNIAKRVKSFSSSFIKRPQTVFYKERYENLAKETKDEFNKTKDISRNLQKIKTNENKKVKSCVNQMRKFSQKQFVYTPQEQKQLQYNFPPYPLEVKEEKPKQGKSFKNLKSPSQTTMLRIQTALAQTRKIHQE